MTISSVGTFAASWDSNKVWRQHWHKIANPIANGAGFWCDLSMSAGTPKFNPYVGTQLEFTPLIGGSNNGINAGLGGDSYIVRYSLVGGTINSTSAWPGSGLLLDYVGFYPLVDMDNTDPQICNNTNYVSRYSNGLRLMVVTTIPQTTPTPTLVQVEYIGSNNVTTVVNFWINAISNAGCLNSFSSAAAATSSFMSPFVPLGVGTIDVKQVNSVTVSDSSGGFCALVLVKPICEVPVVNNTTPYEIEFPRNKVPPFIPNQAYLNHIVCSTNGGTVPQQTRGHIVFARV